MAEQILPPQHQPQQPGLESLMQPHPESWAEHYRGTGKLEGQVALITGGDSGIGRAVAVAFAKEGAQVAIVFRDESEREDAEATAQAVRRAGTDALTLALDVGIEANCQQAVAETIHRFGRLDVLVNNAAEQHVQESILDISAEQLQRTFQTNIFAHFYMVKAALPHLKQHAGRIINTTSVTAYKGNPVLLDYSSTKGAIVAFTRALAMSLADDGIRVNAVAPGPIWTPLIPATFSEEKVAVFGSDVPLKRPGQPDEVAPSYVFLASQDSSYFTGQVLHPNGGSVING